MQAGVGTVIVQALDPPPGYPMGVTQQQVQAAQAAGIAVEAYVYLWTAAPSAIASHLRLLAGYGITRCWLDVEDTSPASATEREQAINTALGIIADLGFTAGIYSGKWYWDGYMRTSAFSGLPLWDSNYDGIADCDVGFRPYGGWTSCALKQYAGTSTFCGVGNVDLSTA